MTTVNLSPQEIHLAALAGVQRNISAIEHKRHTPYRDGSTTAWQANIDGCIGELAVAKYLGTYWSGVAKLGAPDVGTLEVRSTRWTNGDLIVYEKDAPNTNIVLAIISDTNVRLAGYATAAHARTAGTYKTDGRAPAYWLPQTKLYMMENLCRPVNRNQ